MIFIFVVLIVVRIVQAYFLPGTSYYELKWMLLGEWLDEGFMMYRQTYDYTGPIAAVIYKGLNIVFGRNVLAYRALSTLLITLQSGIFNSILLKNKVYSENSYLPAFLFAILSASVTDFMTLSPQLISLTFILLALRNIIRRIDNQATDELFLSSGIYVGVATMIFLPASVFLLVFLFSLILFSSAIPRRLLLYLFGFFLVFVFCALYYYFYDSLFEFVDRAIFNGILLQPKVLLDQISILILISPFAFILLLSGIVKAGKLRLTNFQQKVEQVVWLIMLGGIAIILLSNEKAGTELLFLVPPIAYFWTHYFILLKRRFFKALMPFLLVFGILVLSVVFYNNQLHSILIDVEGTKSKTMVIGEKLELYLSSPILSPFFNGSISKDILDELDSYEGATNFHEIFKSTDPDRIVDQLGAMQKIMHRFPEIQNNYRRVSPTEYIKISN